MRIEHPHLAQPNILTNSVPPHPYKNAKHNREVKPTQLPFLLLYIDLEAKIATLDNSLITQGSKAGIPAFLKKLGSATTKPKVETSIVLTKTERPLNSPALEASRLAYLCSL